MVIAGILAVALSGCSGQPAAVGGNPPEPTSSPGQTVVQEFLTSPDPSAALQQARRRIQVKARRFVVPQDAVTVALHTPDEQCLTYVTEAVLVPRQHDLTETVELILAKQEIPAFDLTGYRLKHDPATKTVTIDLRVSRTSPRLLQSLSFCEQNMLLGSLKETLLNHPEWDIEQVEFTNRGHRLVL